MCWLPADTPKKYRSGYEIDGLKACEEAGALVYHAGTKEENGRFYTAGGRVLGVVQKGKTLKDAIAAGYESVKTIHFQDMHYRKDIGVK